MKCPNCQAENVEGARFCNVCGQPIPAAEPPASPQPPPSPQPPAADQAGYAAPAAVTAGGMPTAPTPAVPTEQMATTPPPPPTPPPAPPGGGDPGLPPGATPAKGFNAGVAALAAFLVVVLLGTAVWFFAIRPSKADEPPAPPTTPPTVEPTQEPTDQPTVEPTDQPTVEPTVEPTLSPTGEPTFGSTEPPPTEEPQPPGQVGFGLNVCGNIGPQGGCIQPGFDRSASSRHFFVRLEWSGAQVGDQIAIDYISTETGAPVSQTNAFTLTAAEGFLTVEFQGPFPRIAFEIVLSYNGQQLQFDRPPVVTLS